ncbi:sugar phosphate isomerase/epimerase [Pseudoflavitalea sp. X16]|uniref:sugar phosphate isomerase/epimerase family protein n=1 Tax=Paraflavitalea devenefica TaxID=2716334 RepID=UPI001421D016|nr:sugar phosphate isomerase/epimerase [Paraflavitalea devenefica]NII26595.1 sugar phosphate isomerase/epimerase [Paraflavitalea devenefica]
MTSRRNFLQQSALSLAGAISLPLVSGAAPGKKEPVLLSTGIAGYTFAKFDLEKAIAMMKKVDIKYLSVKDFHLPLNSNAEKIQSVLKQLADADIKVYAVGVIYMKTQQAVDEAFDYAKRVGVPLIVGVPNPELLDYTEKVVKSSGIRLAIHNHGPEDKLYPGPKNVYDLIKDRDEKMGICLDIGHAIRAGADPAEAIRLYKNRIFDLHIKDVTLAAKDGKAIEVGRGVINFPALVKALHKIRYQGICSIEFEKDMTDPLAGLAESTGYFKGVVKSFA